MARRMRRRRGTWFPNLGTSGPGEGADVDDDDYGLWFRFVLPQVTAGGIFNTQNLIVPLTFDQIEEDNLDVTERLANIIGSEYTLRRVVGNLFIGRENGIDTAAGSYAGVLVTAGLFVARQEDESVNPDIPIGSATPPGGRENYGPSQAATIREPWLWRRRWILGRGSIPHQTSPNAMDPLFGFPATNVGYNGALTSSYIDQKTIRRVGQDDRLFLSVDVRGLGTNWLTPFTANAATVEQTNVVGHLEYRLFGSLRKARQRGAF